MRETATNRFPRRLVRWLRSLSSIPLADEAAEREEYGIADRGRRQLADRERYRGFENNEAASAGLDELAEFEAPRHPKA
ncbi:MAG: hypothetical protein QOI67_1905 [Gaiellaceae bacterium]|jgi:hypothetical protein|nr:hypothetical protein [Gaiellaceae bacterium]